MFELLAGDVFDVEGDLLTVSKLRIGVVGERINTFVHYSFQNEIKLKTANQFCAWLAEGLGNGSIKNLNREADFA